MLEGDGRLVMFDLPKAFKIICFICEKTVATCKKKRQKFSLKRQKI